MSEIPYPKLKYQGVEIKPGQHHTENPGYIYQKVAGPEAETGLGEGWYDTPREAITAFASSASEQRRSEAQEAQARERGIPPAGGEGGGATAMFKGGKSGIAETVAGKDAGGEKPRHTEDWPTESEKKRR